MQKDFIDPRGLSEQAFVDYGHILNNDPMPGQSFAEVVQKYGMEVLVMGGFGHQRLQEFVLGGATDSMLSTPPCPVFMSH